MKAYPKIGTRVVVVAGEYVGRQARTCKTEEGYGRVELDLLGGTHKLGVRVKLSEIERDPERKIRKLGPLSLKEGDKLFSLKGNVYPVGNFITVRRIDGTGLGVIDNYGNPQTLRPSLGFEKRWAHISGHPIAWSYT